MSQDTIVRKIRLSKAKSYVKKAFDKKRPVFLWGPPGIGKSELMQQITEEDNDDKSNSDDNNDEDESIEDDTLEVYFKPTTSDESNCHYFFFKITLLKIFSYFIVICFIIRFWVLLYNISNPIFLCIILYKTMYLNSIITGVSIKKQMKKELF